MICQLYLFLCACACLHVSVCLSFLHSLSAPNQDSRTQAMQAAESHAGRGIIGARDATRQLNALTALQGT